MQKVLRGDLEEEEAGRCGVGRGQDPCKILFFHKRTLHGALLSVANRIAHARCSWKLPRVPQPASGARMGG